MTFPMYFDTFLGAAFLLAIAGVLAAYAFRSLTLGRALDPRIEREPGSILLGRFPIEAVHWAARAVGIRLVRWRVSPDALTLTSLAITLASLPLAAFGFHLLAGCVFLFGAAFDALDGIVARARGMASAAGAALDAITDRYADAAPLIGLALYFRESAWALSIVLAAIIGSMMVSYVRAKHEGMGLDLPGWIMRRAERIAYLGAGLIFGPLVGLVHLPGITADRVILGFVGLIAILSNVAATKLTLEGRAQLLELPVRRPKR
jgi:CDP-diacylglycerol--glycerol-3-phosphate 3-phosphatidyltransferase